MKFNLKDFIILQFVILVFSLTSVFSKISSSLGRNFGIFSMQFISAYGIVISILFLYAIFWQRIIRKFELNVAYSAKATTVVWSLVWAAIFFKEKITINNIIGIIIIVIGIYLVINDE